ncbi:MAG: hypothetical protein Kow0069_11720 [Promethearchaeota archaeon]
MVSQLASNLLQLYVFILVGFVAGRALSGHGEAVSRAFSVVQIYAVVPLQMFLIINTSTFPVDAGFIAQVVALEVGSVVLLMGTTRAHLSGRVDDKKRVGTYLLLNSFPNAMLYPLPIVLAFFGDQYLIVLALFSASALVLRGTLGTWVCEKLGADVHLSLKQTAWRLVTFPPVVGLLVGASVKASGVHLPVDALSTVKAPLNAVSTVGGAALIGLILSSVSIGEVREFWSHVRRVAAWRFGLALAYAATLLPFTRFSVGQTETRTILLLVLVGPPAVFNVTFSVYFDLDAKLAAVSVAALTVVALGVMPVVILAGTRLL